MDHRKRVMKTVGVVCRGSGLQRTSEDLQSLLGAAQVFLEQTGNILSYNVVQNFSLIKSPIKVYKLTL